jgi:hypothetical protein
VKMQTQQLLRNPGSMGPNMRFSELRGNIFLLHPKEMQSPAFMSGITLMFHLCWSSVTGIQQQWRIHTNGGSGKIITVSTAYFSYDSDEPQPTKELKNVINSCKSKKKQLIMDVICRHTI